MSDAYAPYDLAVLRCQVANEPLPFRMDRIGFGGFRRLEFFAVAPSETRAVFVAIRNAGMGNAEVGEGGNAGMPPKALSGTGIALGLRAISDKTGVAPGGATYQPPKFFIFFKSLRAPPPRNTDRAFLSKPATPIDGAYRQPYKHHSAAALLSWRSVDAAHHRSRPRPGIPYPAGAASIPQGAGEDPCRRNPKC